MRNLLLLLLLAAAPARALDQSAFNAVAAQIPLAQPEKYDERAVLAALLARPDVAAEFDADAKAALGDPALKTLLVAKWRGRAAAYAAVSVNRPGVDYSRTYQNWKEVLGPEGYAYLRQRLLSMSKDNSDKLIGYLGLLDQKLKDNNFKIDNSFFSIANKIANGILDEYRKDLTQYLAAPDTKASRSGLGAATTQLAAGIQAKTAVAPAPPHVEEPVVPAQTPPKTRVPVKTAPKTVAPKPAPEETVRTAPAPKTETARQQLDAAHRADQAAGGVFDGGSSNAPVVSAPVDATGQRSNLNGPVPSGLAPSTPRGPVVGAVPSPLDDLDSRVAKAGQSGAKPYAGKLGLYMGGGGALLGGLVGFLLGGPIGALIGAAVLGGAGFLVSKRF